MLCCEGTVGCVKVLRVLRGFRVPWGAAAEGLLRRGLLLLHRAERVGQRRVARVRQHLRVRACVRERESEKERIRERERAREREREREREKERARERE